MAHYHINVRGAISTFSTSNQEVAAHHQVHGAEVWETDFLSPVVGETRFPNLRPFYRHAGSLSCNYCGFGNPCSAKVEG